VFEVNGTSGGRTMSFALAGAALLTCAFLAAACGFGSSKPSPSAASGSAPQTAVQTASASGPTFQAALATPMTNPVDRVDGTVQSIDRGTVTLKEGGSFTVSDVTKMSHGPPASPVDLVPGKVVAVAAMMQPDNTLLASAISIYNSAPNSAFFRQYPLDHNNLMTNATIDSGSGNAFTVAFPGGGAKVTLAPDAEIITIVPATMADLNAGETVTALVLNGVAQVVSIIQ
jgi:Domain of unknown function (DUF5666)